MKPLFRTIKDCYLLGAVVISLLVSGLRTIHAQQKPNVIYILADDLGYGDLSCYGQTKFTTPNIDKIARNGMKFTNHYSGSTVSAPSRSSLMTGQHTGHTPVRGNSKSAFIPDSTVTVAEIFKSAGYVTGMFGKWGLGGVDTPGGPNKQGFDEFYGFTNQGYAHRYYPDHIIHNNAEIPLPGNDWTQCVTYATDFIHEKAIDFIDRNNANPFFLYYPCNIPHAELIVPKDSILEKFEGKFLPEKRYSGKDYIGPGTNPNGYCSQNQGHAVFAAMVYRLDRYVGEIVKKLEEHRILENTLVLFTSDNGPHNSGGADPEYFGSCGGLRGIKRDLYEGGIRVPFIAHWPGKIQENSVSDHISTFWDFLPTCADLVSKDLPSGVDGISFLPELLRQGGQQKADYIYWEFYENNGRRGVRMDKWKAVQYSMKSNPNSRVQLFRLDNDPKEQNNIFSHYEDTAFKLLNVMEMSHRYSNKFSWAYENNSVRVTFVILENGKPKGDMKVTLSSNGTRVSWKNGQAVFTGVPNFSNPELSLYHNGSVIYTKRIRVTTADIVDTIDLINVSISYKPDKKQGMSLMLNQHSRSLTIKSNSRIDGIEVYNLSGKKIIYNKTGACNAQLLLRNLPVGIYTIKVYCKKKDCYRKIVFFN